MKTLRSAGAWALLILGAGAIRGIGGQDTLNTLTWTAAGVIVLCIVAAKAAK